MFSYFCGRKPHACQKLFRGWQMEIKGLLKICYCPTPGTDKPGKCSAVAQECGWVQLELTDHNTKTPSFVKFLLRTIENYPGKTQGGLKGLLEINFIQKRSCEMSSNTNNRYVFIYKKF